MKFLSKVKNGPSRILKTSRNLCIIAVQPLDFLRFNSWRWQLLLGLTPGVSNFDFRSGLKIDSMSRNIIKIRHIKDSQFRPSRQDSIDVFK